MGAGTLMGNDARNAVENFTPMNFDAISNANPYGGVINPNANVTISTTPICTELIPATSVNWFTTGMKIMIAGMGSMKSPTITNTATSSSMIMPASVPATLPIQPATTIGPRK